MSKRRNLKKEKAQRNKAYARKFRKSSNGSYFRKNNQQQNNTTNKRTTEGSEEAESQWSIVAKRDWLKFNLARKASII